jgi:hypothetical protein
MLEELANSLGINSAVIDDLATQVEDIFNPWYGKNAPAHWAAGYLEELTGEDMHKYILDCYEDSKDLELQMLIAMDYYEKDDRENGDKTLQ